MGYGCTLSFVTPPSSWVAIRQDCQILIRTLRLGVHVGVRGGGSRISGKGVRKYKDVGGVGVALLNLSHFS